MSPKFPSLGNTNFSHQGGRGGQKWRFSVLRNKRMSYNSISGTFIVLIIQYLCLQFDNLTEIHNIYKVDRHFYL